MLDSETDFNDHERYAGGATVSNPPFGKRFARYTHARRPANGVAI